LGHLYFNQTRSISEIAMDLRLTVSWLYPLFNQLEEIGIVESKKFGSRKEIYLTKKGKDIAQMCYTFKLLVKDIEKEKDKKRDD